jgi:hypothetical protein
MDLPTPTDGEWLALLDYRDRHGRTWAFDLWTAWQNANDVLEPHGVMLRTIRNRLGPSWLQRLTRADLERERSRFTLAPAGR